MKRRKSLCRLFIFVLLFLIVPNISYSASGIIVSIKVNGVAVLPGPTKTVEVCFGGQYNLLMSNSGTKPIGKETFEWKNIDSLTSSNTFQINAPEAGRWVATIRYYNTNNGTVVTESDTVHLVYATTSSLQILTSQSTAIPTTNIYICGLSDSTFLASSGHTDYKWYKDNISQLVSSTNSLNITNTLLSAGEGTISFFLTATNAFGCEVTAQKNIRRDNSFVVDIGPDQNKCSAVNVILSSPKSPSGILFGYKWSTLASTSTITVNTTGTYWLKVTNGGTKCSQSDTAKITFSAIPNIEVTKDTTICNGTSVQLNATVTNGSGPYTYSWTPSVGLSDPSISNPIATPANLGATTYSVNVSDPLGCGGASANSTKIIQLNPYSNLYFSLTAGNDTSICFKSEAMLKPEIIAPSYPANYAWKWTPSDGLSSSTEQNPKITLNTPGTYKYIVSVTDDRGCQLKDSVKITNSFELTTTTNFSDTLSCVGTPITLIANATGGSSNVYTYNFTTSEGIISNNQLTLALIDSTYIIKVSATDSEGCDSPQIPVNFIGYKPYIQIASGTDTLGFGGKPLKLVANIKNKPSVSVTWYDSPTNAIIEYGLTYTSTVNETIYAEAIDNFYNCSNRDSVRIEHRIEDLHALFVPNVFSPKALNIENQQLKVYGTLIQETDFNFSIYNQWGQLVYQTTSFIEANSLGWNGEIKGNNGQQSSNTYTYTLIGKFFDGVDFNKTGTASLLQ